MFMRKKNLEFNQEFPNVSLSPSIVKIPCAPSPSQPVGAAADRIECRTRPKSQSSGDEWLKSGTKVRIDSKP